MSDEETIFTEALSKRSAEERTAFLKQACGGDAALRAQVDVLLAAHEQVGEFLESPPPGIDAHGPAAAPPERAPAIVGPYKLLQQIGEGGMGVVYMAEQLRPVRRVVAVKIIKPGLDSRQVIARFEAERQALAMMDHPNIAKVFDAGTTDDGRPYFVMELVRGVPITQYCDQQQLTPRQRLELFIQVCQAVQHAHQKGIIHRDLKPSNVLITLQDGDKPTPKVIDFGIAKATVGQRLTDLTLFTEFKQLIGTPLYMSPEQAEMSAVMDVDTRSDVYSLGVLLYELLTGTTPFDKQRLATAAFDEVRRILREEEPPRPSTRLSTLGDTITTISASRHSDPKKLSQTVRGELDWIVMKALEKDRARRYETANGLARDIERYLTDQPVEACPPSRLYRLKKFARRNKAVLVTAAVVAMVFVAASIVSTWEALRAQRATAIAVREANHARSEADKQRAVNDFLNTMLQSANPWMRNSSEPSNGKDVTVLEAINAAVRKLDAGALRDHPEIEAAVRKSIGTTYQGLDRLDLAQVQLREALRLSRVAYGAESSDVADSMILLGWCNLYYLPMNLSESEPFLRQGVAMQKKFLGKSPVVADGLRRLCELLVHENKPVEAEQVAREALEIDPSGVGALASALRDQHRYAESESLYKQAVTIDRQRYGENTLAVHASLYELGGVCAAQSKLPEAEAALTEALAIRHALGMDEVPMREWLARIHIAQSKYVEAEQDLREARRLDPHRRDLAFHIAYILQHQSKNAEAARAVQEGMSLWEEQTKGQFASADTPQKRAAIYLSLVETLSRCRLWKEARETFQKVVDLPCDNAETLNNIAWALVVTPQSDFYDPVLAVQAAKRAVELAPNAATQWNTLGVALYRTGDYAKAIDALEKSRALDGDEHFSHDAFFLAMAHYRLGHLDEARDWYTQSIAWMDKNAPKDPELLIFRSEASELLHVANSTTAPAPTSRPQPGSIRPTTSESPAKR